MYNHFTNFSGTRCVIHNQTTGYLVAITSDELNVFNVQSSLLVTKMHINGKRVTTNFDETADVLLICVYDYTGNFEIWQFLDDRLILRMTAKEDKIDSCLFSADNQSLIMYNDI